MLVSVQSPQGSKRIECHTSDSFSSFLSKVREAFKLDKSSSLEVFRNRNRTDKVVYRDRKPISSCNINHGDTVYVVYQYNANSSNAGISTLNSTLESVSSAKSSQSSNLLECDVDTYLYKQDGKIERKKDDKLCQHGPYAKCIHCVPLEPYHEGFLREQNIKHLSFHSYLRKLTDGADRGKFAALENISCKIKSGCTEHSPWPKGICTKCQPSAITLNRQKYRHVDNVMFENPFLVERFLNYWRNTNRQRIGFLYGRYEVHKDVPLGIKATVAAIYEPPQESSPESINLLLDTDSELVDEIGKALGLVKVGWIFTDLVAEDTKIGTVKYLRNSSSYFLSAQECIMAGYFQNKHPNICKISPNGYFGSKFVTVCFTGDADHHVHMEGYQVSNQCMALVRDSCLVPTIDAPELGYVIESTNEQYVPDVFYKDKDTYGNEISKPARPLPIEYMLVDVPVSTPVEPVYTFHLDQAITPFPVENRMVEVMQDYQSLAMYLRQFPVDKFLEAMSDFHLLLYIAKIDMVPLKEHMAPLLEAVKTKNSILANRWAQNEYWSTLEQLIHVEGFPHTMSQSNDEPMTTSTSGSVWTCPLCTYHNAAEVRTCEMCNNPL